MPTTLASHAVIGAGIAGLACARVLTDAGHRVCIFDKARGPGGRMSSRRLEKTVIDLGAQSLRVEDPAFAAEVATWQAAGAVAPWPEELWQLEAGQLRRIADAHPRFCGTPRMSAVTRHLSRGLTLQVATRIIDLERAADGWRLVDQTGRRHGPFAQVVLALPAPQAAALVAPHDAPLAAACRDVPQRACWAAWAGFDTSLTIPGLPDDWPALQLPAGPLRLVSRQRSKPGRADQPETLVLLARLDWSERHLEAAPGDVVAHLLDALLDALRVALPAGSVLPLPRESGAHRWRLAEPEPAAASGDADFRLGTSGLALCGDGWRGARIEDAWLSGHHLGETLTQRHIASTEEIA